MHPVERLRYVARVDGAPVAALAREAASALAEVAVDAPAGLVPGCRGLVARHPTNGPLWWLGARILSAADPWDAAREAAAALAADPTGRRLAAALPEDTTVLVVGWPDATAEAIGTRRDIEVLVVDAGGDGAALARRLADDDRDAAVVPDSGVAAAASVAGLVIVEATAAGPGGVLAAPGSHAAAAVARRAGVPVWAVTPTGTVLPAPLWDVLLSQVDASGLEPWDREVELVVADLLDVVAGPDGSQPTGAGLATTTCPLAPELLRLPG